MTLLIAAEELWFAATNCYVVARERGDLAVVVDAPPDADAVGGLLAKYDLTPVALLVTHGHVDHCGGAGAIVERTGIDAYVHPDDDFLTLHPADQIRRLFGAALPAEALAEFAPPEHYEALDDGDSLDIAGLGIDVIHTPGHTPGHCCFHVPEEGVLFSGDQLFAGSIGRTDLPGGDYDTLMDSMREKVLPLADDTRVLPGHGPATTLGRERMVNPFLQELLSG